MSLILERYRYLFDLDAPVLPAGSHRVAWTLARRAGDKALQRLLVARLDAPEDLRDQYAQLKDADLRGVFLTRLDQARDPWEHAASLTTVTDIVAALRTSRFHPAVVDAAVSRLRRRPTLRLAQALADTPEERVTGDLAHLVTSTLAGDDKGRVPADRVLARVGRDRARQILAVATNARLVAQLARFDVGDDAARSALERLGLRTVLVCNEAGLAAVADRRPGSDLAAWILGEYPGLARPDRWREKGSTVLPWRRPAKQPGRDTGRPEGQVTVAEALASRDPRLLAAAVDQALSLAASPKGRAGFERIARLCLMNPHLSVTDRHRLVGALGANRPETGALARFDATAWVPGDVTVARAWYTAYPQRMDRAGWGPLVDGFALRLLIDQWLADPAAYLTHLAQALQAGVPAQLAMRFPLPLLRQVQYQAGESQAVQAMSVHTEHLVADRLGVNEQAWEVYAGLYDTFEASLADAVDTALAVAA